jgi:hypothetical protein
MAGPKGTSRPLDCYDGTAPPVPNTVTGYLVPAPKQINPGDPKVGPKKGASGQINLDTFCE